MISVNNFTSVTSGRPFSRNMTVAGVTGAVVINGKSYNPRAGGSVSIENGAVYVDGVCSDPTIPSSTSATFNVKIEGTVGSIRLDVGSVTVAGDVDTIGTASGDVVVNGHVRGAVNTMSGDVDIRGDLHGNATTMSGDIKSGYVQGAASTKSGRVNVQRRVRVVKQ